jgi:hypothetical protein
LMSATQLLSLLRSNANMTSCKQQQHTMQFEWDAHWGMCVHNTQWQLMPAAATLAGREAMRWCQQCLSSVLLLLPSLKRVLL